MTDDRTLSDFSSTAADDADSTVERQSDSSEADDDARDSDAVETARTDGETPPETAQSSGDTGFSTYAWGTYTCGRCETETGRVWREKGEFVCSGCKSW